MLVNFFGVFMVGDKKITVYIADNVLYFDIHDLCHALAQSITFFYPRKDFKLTMQKFVSDNMVSVSLPDKPTYKFYCIESKFLPECFFFRKLGSPIDRHFKTIQDFKFALKDWCGKDIC